MLPSLVALQTIDPLQLQASVRRQRVILGRIVRSEGGDRADPRLDHAKLNRIGGLVSVEQRLLFTGIVSAGLQLDGRDNDLATEAARASGAAADGATPAFIHGMLIMGFIIIIGFMPYIGLAIAGLE
jgi:hypothetical protein